ncbi:MAG: hypothetical protein LUG64_02390 [Clostridiales bacterium]|nr:hypothetical protein [Clostridiales bacterium]
MYFILALIAWGYIGIQLMREQINKEVADAEYAARERKCRRLQEEHPALYQEFCDKYVDESLVIIFSQSCTLLRPKDEEETLLVQRIQDEVGIKPTVGMVTVAKAAQQGRIPRQFANGGIRASTGSKVLEERRFFTWYNKELQAHGMEYQMMYVASADVNKFEWGELELATPVSEDTNGKDVRGYYLWMPQWNWYETFWHAKLFTLDK